ncbi:MAG: cupin domain-containing protein [Pirellulales bacterium]
MSRYVVDKGDCSRHTIFPGVQIFTTYGQHSMLSLVEFEPGSIVQEHSHPHEQLGLLLEGELQFTIGGEPHRVLPGMMWRIPGGVKHSAVAGSAGAKALDTFYPIREDYK